MYILSAITYFFAHYTFLPMLALALLFGMLGGAIAAWRKQPAWGMLFIAGFFFGGINAFTGHIVNALLLNAAGVRGSAVIVHSSQTNNMLNEHYVWEYDVVLKTAAGDMATKVDDMSASIYPVRNQILIPPEGQAFIIKYVPGFERNFVIMSDESQYGKERLIALDFQPVEKAAAQLEVSPDNSAFIEEYRTALQKFINAHRDDADPRLIEGCEQKLNSLGPASK